MATLRVDKIEIWHHIGSGAYSYHGVGLRISHGEEEWYAVPSGVGYNCENGFEMTTYHGIYELLRAGYAPHEAIERRSDGSPCGLKEGWFVSSSVIEDWSLI